jgi:predicted transcriptional regulator
MDIPIVKDFMTEGVITASSNESMNDLISKLLNRNVSGAPVVDDEKNIVGLISGKDVLKGLSVDTFHRLGTGFVRDYMSIDVFTIDQDKDIFIATDIFYNTNYRRIPVVNDENKLIGIVTRKDVIRAMEKFAKESSDERSLEWANKK